MVSTENLQALRDLAGDVSQREGVVLYDLEFKGSAGNRTLKIMIDASERGVTIKDCENVSKGLSLLLDVKDLIPGGRYDLEVSSPGLDRPLRVAQHFAGAVGETIRVKTLDQKAYTGKLLTFENEELVLDTGAKSKKTLKLDQVKKANVIFEMKPKGKKR